jgi:uncharacterized cupin superfamily protein
MKLYNLNQYIGGWIIGNFHPSIIKTNNFEIAIKKYKAGDFENRHYHKIADEITIIINGKVKMNDNIYLADDIVYIDKNQSTDFYCFEDTTTCVVKIPSVTNDKYLS